MKLSVGDYLLGRLAELGVRHLFGVPGDYNLWFLEQAERSDRLSFVGCCNELNAAYAADGAARLAGISAMATTYGVGELGAIGGVAGAYAEHVPVVCVVGTPPLHAVEGRALLHHTLADGDFSNMLACYRAFTVAQARIEPANARQEIDRVLRQCWLHKRPVYLQLPSDVAALMIEAPAGPLDLEAGSDPDQIRLAVARIAARLAKARAPAILLDADVGRFGLGELVLKLAEARAIPFATLTTAKGVVDEGHELHLGTYGGAGSRPATRSAIEEADCLLCIGVRFTDMATGLFTHQLRPEAQIHLRAFDAAIGMEHFAGVTAREVLAALPPALPVRSRRPLPASLVAPLAAREPAPVEPGRPLSQLRFWQRMQDFIRPRDVVLADNGTSTGGTMGLRLPAQVSFIMQPIWAAIGYALPALLGTLLAAPKRRQLLFIGDGAFQMTAQELSTILRHGLKPIIFLINNDGYTIERLIYGANSSYNDINPWRYAQAASFFDTQDRALSLSVQSEDELERALALASEASSLVLIELVMDRMDAPGALTQLARKAAEFDFPQLTRTAELDTTKAGPARDLPAKDLPAKDLPTKDLADPVG